MLFYDVSAFFVSQILYHFYVGIAYNVLKSDMPAGVKYKKGMAFTSKMW